MRRLPILASIVMEANICPLPTTQQIMIVSAIVKYVLPESMQVEVVRCVQYVAQDTGKINQHNPAASIVMLDVSYLQVVTPKIISH
jgi:hypothetical protein